MTRRPSVKRRWTIPTGALLLGLVLTAACGGRGGDDGPTPPPPPPDLTGVRIMLLPAQAPAPGQLDAELAFWLADRTPTTDWVLPETLQRAADRAPAWRMRLDALQRPVAELGGGDRRVRDPLYAALRQLGALVDSDYALVPIRAVEGADSTGVRVDLAMAVVEVRGGRVVWLHTVRGEGNPTVDAAVASAAEAVARTLAP